MDPFTEKLLERTRARRENLQKKMAERPNAANRPVVKRPLADTNGVMSEPVIDKVPQPSSKPSPSKRRCSEENAQSENQEPAATKPLLSDPPTDKKPPAGPSSRHSSLEKNAARPEVRSEPAELKTVRPQPEKMTVTPQSSHRETLEEMVPACPAPHRPRENPVEAPAPHRPRENPVEAPVPGARGMKSRLQMLAEQRKGWGGDSPPDEVPDCTALSMLKRAAEVAPAPAPSSVPSGTPVGRRGRLANLAATIGSWEDDLSHANIPKVDPKEKPKSVVVIGTKGPAAGKQSGPNTGSTSSFGQVPDSSIKSNRAVPPSPQKVPVPAAKASDPSVTSSHQMVTITSSPSKSCNPGIAVPSSPQKTGPSSATTVPQSPLKSRVLPGGLNPSASPRKPELAAKPAVVGTTAPQEKSTVGGPGVKSFVERFGERCQESTAGGHTKTPTPTPPVTPNTRLVQERLRAAQAANTSTADLTQKQKMERETELAKIRSRFQKGNNMWKNKDEETKKNVGAKDQLHETKERDAAKEEPRDGAAAQSIRPTDEPAATAPPTEKPEAPPTEKPEAPPTEKPNASAPFTTTGYHLAASPPAMASSPRKAPRLTVEKPAEKEEVVTEREMSVDQSINSQIINDLFDGILEQSNEEEEEEEDEEDVLNISSMSILLPLAETVGAVVNSPGRRMMTSTPASSFIVKSPHSDCNPSKFQRANVNRASSSDSLEPSDEERKLLYSVDAYRSIRGKETDRPNVKQVIVRNEDVSHRAEEPRSSHFNIKQRMKVLTNDMNLQQTVIHQASQALNCCTDEEHGKGSQVEAEAERLLLVAMERREALKAELDRLRGGGAAQKKASAAPELASVSASKGSISLQELRLPLKADFVCSIANKPESTKHSFFIMIRAGVENTVSTPLATTHRGLSGDTLTFPTKFTISDVSSDFVIDIEVYCLVQKRDVCSDKKKKPSKSKTIWRRAHEAHDLCLSAITPKRFLGISKSVQTPVVASPGGPNAVRSSNFVLVGSHKLTLSSIGKNKFPLEKMKYEGCERELLRDLFHAKVPFLCPLEGHVYLKLQCEVGSKLEERGFLTMFEDVSGFGSWHRRWCVLSGYCISYWTYPDDERRKNPIGRINLANCTSRKVEPVNREFCARPNTFELITVRPQRESDRETLVSQCKDTMCVTKNWLSADTKDERNLWMKTLNQILVDLRMWQPDSCYRPPQ